MLFCGEEAGVERTRRQPAGPGCAILNPTEVITLQHRCTSNISEGRDRNRPGAKRTHERPLQRAGGN
ncbi:hypothetical protein BN2476_200014 [Paraburkholderia piptadeniae]|uniref:Uncharacterized protein n=1 Tax=Paraburkholderia piptadeniae TaxID=1701573 RepID=A0A1N7RVT9_9BURK|nr:hypothetical protein BN2476_200014 [Paraburkholderia piptadeniae]